MELPKLPILELATHRTEPDPVTTGGVRDTVARKLYAIQLLSQGYTTRAVVKKMQTAAIEPFDEVELVQFRQTYAREVADLQEQQDREVLETGLARKSERVRRLSELAERLEHDLEREPDAPVPLKVSDRYLRVVEAIRDEVDPLSIGRLTANDPWVILLTRLSTMVEDPRLPSSSPSLLSSGTSSPTPSEPPLSVELVKSSSLEESEAESPLSQQQS